MTNATLRGMPDAENPHVWFDKGDVASEKQRRRSLSYKSFVVAAALILAGGASAAVTNEIFVAAGDTTTLSLPGTPANGDWVVKTGPGTLNAVNTYKAVKLNFHIKEGVYFVPNSQGDAVHKGDNAKLIIADGACVNIEGGKINQFSGWWDITFAGHGTGTGNNLGAICIGGGQTNPTLSTGGRFTMTGDATIYSYGTMNAVFSGSSATSGSSLVMNGHTLTVRGNATTAVFRPRWKWTVTQPGTIVIRNGQFARHDTTNDFGSDIPLVKVTENGKLAAYDNNKIWSKVKAFEFDYGSSMAAGNGSPTTATLTMKKLTGPATISDTVLTVSQDLVVRGTDLVDGHYLTSGKALTFADGCKISISDWGSLSFAPGARYVVAESSVGITGTPTVSGTATDFFTIEKSDTQLTLVAKSTNKVPALQVGVENAEANSQVMAAMTLADGDTLCFPAGEYHFSEPIDLSAATASNVTICGRVEAPCTLRAQLKLGAMKEVSVRNLKFTGLATPAIVATGTAGLTVEGCTLEAVKGAYGELGNYPYAFVNVTDLKVTGSVYVKDAKGAESTLWDAAAYFDGGSQTADSVARAGEIVAYLPSGVWENDWRALSDYLSDNCHLTNTAYTGKLLRKTGPATLDVTSSNDVTSVEIEKGQLVARANSSLGVAQAPVHVCNGAALTLAGASKTVDSRVITFSGTGINSTTPAIRFTGDAKWDKTQYVDWTLEGDATMYNNCSGECGTFLWGTLHMGGHTLTLKGIAASNYRFGRTCDWYGGGTVVVDKVTLSASTSTGSSTAFAVKDAVGKPLFKFINGAKFLPDNTDILNLIRDVDFAAGTTIGLKDDTAGFALAFDSLTGTPAIGNAFTKLTVRSSYSARLADLQAGKTLTLDAVTPFAFGNGATVTILADALTAPTETYVLISAPGGITGRKPTLDAAAKAAGWGLGYSADRKALLVGPQQGLFLLVR